MGEGQSSQLDRALRRWADRAGYRVRPPGCRDSMIDTVWIAYSDNSDEQWIYKWDAESRRPVRWIGGSQEELLRALSSPLARRELEMQRGHKGERFTEIYTHEVDKAMSCGVVFLLVFGLPLLIGFLEWLRR